MVPRKCFNEFSIFRRLGKADGACLVYIDDCRDDAYGEVKFKVTILKRADTLATMKSAKAWERREFDGYATEVSALLLDVCYL